MENENGTWIIYGVDWDAPECIHTVDEAQNYDAFCEVLGTEILID